MSEWTDEIKQAVIAKYLSNDPTPENSLDIVKEIAEEFDKTPNGVRMILSKANVYVKKSDSAAKGEKGGKEKTTRVSRQDSLDGLVSALEKADQEVNMEVIDKLTGKAAVYFTSVVSNLTGK